MEELLNIQSCHASKHYYIKYCRENKHLLTSPRDIFPKDDDDHRRKIMEERQLPEILSPVIISFLLTSPYIFWTQKCAHLYLYCKNVYTASIYFWLFFVLALEYFLVRNGSDVGNGYKKSTGQDPALKMNE